MHEETLFPFPAAESANAAPLDSPWGGPRLAFAVRDQVEMLMTDRDGLVSADHPVRMVWAFVEAQGLGGLYDRIAARGSKPGRGAIDPRILMALWLNATLNGVGSARELDRRCTEDITYRWLCGGVSVNSHPRSDFRVAHGDFLDERFTRNVAALLAEGLVERNRVAQDGMRVRARAGASSYRRNPTLEACLAEARTQVERLRAEREESLKGENPIQGKGCHCRRCQRHCAKPGIEAIHRPRHREDKDRGARVCLSPQSYASPHLTSRSGIAGDTRQGVSIRREPAEHGLWGHPCRQHRT